MCYGREGTYKAVLKILEDVNVVANPRMWCFERRAGYLDSSLGVKIFEGVFQNPVELKSASALP